MAPPSFAEDTLNTGSSAGLGIFNASEGSNSIYMYYAQNKPHAFGWFVDGYYAGPSDDTEGHFKNLNETSFGDQVTQTDIYYTGLSVGTTYSFNRHLSLYVAGAVTWQKEVVELYDPTHFLAEDGIYTVDGEHDTHTGLTFGLVGGIERIAFKLGTFSALDAYSIAIGYRF